MTHERYCGQHHNQAQARERAERRRHDQERGTAAERGYGSRWQKARKGYLAVNPLCVDCRDESRFTPATVVDHVEPHKGNQKLFWDRDNWQGLCEMHHNRKTASRDGGWGRGG